MNNKSFFDTLVQLNENVGQFNNIGYIDKPVNHNEGFRFDYPFNYIRFDSVDGWQKHHKYKGWQKTTEHDSSVIKLRIKYDMLYIPCDEEMEVYEAKVKQVLTQMSYDSARASRIRSEWDKIKDLRPIPATESNIYTMLRYFHEYGEPDSLPPLSVGYSLTSYDCDGKTAVAIKLDSPIPCNNAEFASDRFQYGAPRGYLPKYKRAGSIID